MQAFYNVNGKCCKLTRNSYIADSIKHFVTGSVISYAKPNYDWFSMPAADRY
jgi:hypothetical protein